MTKLQIGSHILDTVALRDSAQSIAHDWDEPLPLDGDRVLGTFPLESLPQWLRDAVRDFASELQVPEDMIAMLTLGALSSLIAGSVSATHRTWSEPTNLYVMVAMGPGERKSAAFRECFEPVYQLERDLASRFAENNASLALTRRLLETNLERAMEEAAKKRSMELTDVIRELETSIRTLPRPKPVQLLMGNTTSEALVLRMQENGGMAIVASAEGGELVELMKGRYSKTRAPDIDVYLQAHAGDAIRHERISRQAVRVDHPCLSIVCTVQQSVLRQLAEAESSGARGLFERFLFCIPRSFIGDRKSRPAVARPEVRTAYRRKLGALGMYFWAAETRRETRLELSSEAGVEFDAWRDTLEPMRKGTGPHARQRALSSKLEGLCLRIVASLHVAEVLDSAQELEAGKLLSEIGVSTLRKAIAVAEFAFEHSCEARRTAHTSDAGEQLRTVLAWVRVRETFTKRELMRSPAAAQYCDTSKEADKVIGRMVELEWIRCAPRRSTGGRPKIEFLVNPLLGEKSEP